MLSFLLEPWFFFIVLGVFVIADVALFSFEKYFWSFTVMVGTIVGAYLIQPTFAAFLQGNWLHILTHYVPVYLAIGLATAVVKWMLFTVKHVQGIKDIKAKFDVKYPIDQNVEFDHEERARERLQDEYKESVRRRNINKQQMMADRGGPFVTANGSGPMTAEEFDAKYPAPEAPNAPVYEPDVMAARRREFFVQFYQQSFISSERPDVYTDDIDYKKETSLVDALTPLAKENIPLITIWIFQWPLVILATVFEDFVINLAKHTGRLLDAMFSYFSRKLVAHATKGL